MIVLEIINGALHPSIECKKGAILADVLHQAQIPFGMPCGGKGICGKCKLQIPKGNTTPVTPSEKKWLSEKALADNIRLACFFSLETDTQVVLPKQEGHQILQAVSQPNQGNEQLKKSMIDLVAQIQGESLYGIAVDIGTTTVVAYLVDGKSGLVLDSVCRLNAQKAFGDDVISRIQWTMEKEDGTQRLHDTMIEQLNAMIQHICMEKKIHIRQIGGVAICANTILTHFLLKLPTESMSRAPFTPIFTDLGWQPADAIGLQIHPDGMVAIAPGKSGYVGGDIIAGAAICGMHQREEIGLFLDIGTNGEIVLGRAGELYCCATAAGPAFEGCHIECGTGGVLGAIHRFSIVEGVPAYDTIGNVPPVGICGSGILDVVAALLKAGIIDETGFMEDHYHITDTIYLSPKDIREIQLAKAAICAGIQTLTKEAGIELEDITTVFLAGGFGNYLNQDSALEIGLIPKVLAGKIETVGNTSGSGAIEMIYHQDFFDILNMVKNQMTYIELSSNSYFMNTYIEEMMFPE